LRAQPPRDAGQATLATSLLLLRQRNARCRCRPAAASVVNLQAAVARPPRQVCSVSCLDSSRGGKRGGSTHRVWAPACTPHMHTRWCVGQLSRVPHAGTLLAAWQPHPASRAGQGWPALLAAGRLPTLEPRAWRCLSRVEYSSRASVTSMCRFSCGGGGGGGGGVC